MGTVQAYEAAISTVTIEIKTLMVSNRQMTQAIFRQLEERWAWADPGEWPYDDMEGPIRIWGKVNYHFRGCCRGRDPKTHINVVFSAGGALYRYTVNRGGNQQEYAEAAELPQLFIAG